MGAQADSRPGRRAGREERVLVSGLALFASLRLGSPHAPRHRERLRALLEEPLALGALLRLARRHRVEAALARTMREHADDLLAGDAARTLRGLERDALVREERAFLAFRALSRALAAERIVHAAYKGPALSLSAYGELGLRAYADLDLIVARRDAVRALEVLASCGYRFPCVHGASTLDRALAAHFHVLGTRASAFADRELELHVAAEPFAVDDDAMSGERLLAEGTREVEALPVLQASTERTVVARHHARHGWPHLGQVLDVALLRVDGASKDPAERWAAQLGDALVGGEIVERVPPFLAALWRAEEAPDLQGVIGRALTLHASGRRVDSDTLRRMASARWVPPLQARDLARELGASLLAQWLAAADADAQATLAAALPSLADASGGGRRAAVWRVVGAIARRPAAAPQR